MVKQKWKHWNMSTFLFLENLWILFKWYYEVLEFHEYQDQEERKEEAIVSSAGFDFDEKEDFSFWGNVVCCQKPKDKQQRDEEDLLPNLCYECDRCKKVRTFIETKVY